MLFGKWNKLNGYITPGGDPVYACSSCGGSEHLYGVEHRKRKQVCDVCGRVNSYPGEEIQDQSDDPKWSGLFTVIDKSTGEYPDVEEIALHEDWAQRLVYCDIDSFVISEDGTLMLMDDCGNVAYCPSGRFEVIYQP